ncbi:hypothetical protein [Actinomadura decatromicini]|uniref:Secreted protein n=1 Tax=Actinomadura decatromicini TaxID=2604572 RepID=A0A5D3FWS9_9ACTN|nr:hypothetical protein [Actinomadura decatromicini]TYK52604.1 hypothetical protein FXF68_02200 [Actinomadura decatromicini]
MRSRTAMATLAMASAGIALPLAFTSPAYADASGASPWGEQSAGGVTIPAGVLGHDISGSGLKINYEKGTFRSIACISEWRIDFYYTSKGKRYKTSKGATHGSCSRTGVRTVGKATLKAGLACAVIYSHGRKLTEQCHQITK